jgi:hypothetical protein
VNLIKRGLALLTLACLLLAAPAFAGAPPTAITISAVSTANNPVTLTIPASGAGTFHVLIAVYVTRTCTTAIVGANVLTVTTANLPGSMAWTMGDACGVGTTNNDVVFQPGPIGVLASTANTNTTVTCPATGATGICRVSAVYQIVVP